MRTILPLPVDISFPVLDFWMRPQDFDKWQSSRSRRKRDRSPMPKAKPSVTEEKEKNCEEK